MKKFEGKNMGVDDFDFEDYADEPYYRLLKRLPSELASRQIKQIEKLSLSKEEATKYIINILNKREHAVTETVISDEAVKEMMGGREDSVFNDLDTKVFEDPECHIGAGTTARVKRYMFDTQRGTEIPMAIKYLVTPNERTLTAAGEHDIIREVRNIQAIEQISNTIPPLKYAHVPHPYFHHKTEKIQYYGMEFINGFNLEQAIGNKVTANKLRQLKEKFAHIDEAEIVREVNALFDTMHQHCLHGDIKPRNIMTSTAGMFYIIDFGQAKLINELNEKEMVAAENVKDLEREGAVTAIKIFLQKLRQFDDSAYKIAA